MMSKSDPFVVVFVKDPKDIKSGWKEYFRTKTLENDHNPVWSDQIIITYQFEAMQDLKFVVYDRDSKSEKLSDHDLMGSFETSMSEIMGTVGCTISGPLTKTKKRKVRGKIIITGQEIHSCADICKFQFKASKLERKNMMGLGKSDPFYEISQARGENEYLKVFTGEVVKSNTSPIWLEQQVPVQVLSNGAIDRELKVDVYDWESNGKHKFIGCFHATLDEMRTKHNFTLKNPNAKKNKDKSRGNFEIMSFEVIYRPTFLEYIQGGLEMNLLIAVDFTGSNGHPKDRGSLHFMPKGFEYTGGADNVEQFNQYQVATWSVGRILQDYDHDKNMPLYGFGGYFNDDTHHCFPLNFNNANPEVHRIEGVMQTYKSALLSCQLSGPTYFGPVLQQAIGAAEELSSTKNSQKYAVLLILTDGVINDMEKTVQLLIEGSSTPLSVIIVGVGNADFKNMEKLDGDGALLKLNGKTAKRDIVQFVPFNDFFKNWPTALAEEVLKEIPMQVVEYFYINNGIKPLPKQDPPKTHYIDEVEDIPVAEVA